jgi:hypothetical protein
VNDAVGQADLNLGGVIEHSLFVGSLGTLEHNGFQIEAGPIRIGEEFVQIIDIALMVLSIVKTEGSCGNDRFQSVFSIRQGRKRNGISRFSDVRETTDGQAYGCRPGGGQKTSPR